MGLEGVDNVDKHCHIIGDYSSFDAEWDEIFTINMDITWFDLI